MENFIKIEIKTSSSENLEILIAELSEIDFYAFEQNKNILIAYIVEKKFDELKLQETLPNRLNYQSTVIANRNWNLEWEQGFQPVYINVFAGIRASFHQPLQNVKYEIIVTPKMSFGTGHHPTTYLMIEQMEGINFRNKTVLDFGTGTGVLSILSEKLGASKVIAIDNDEWSMINAVENIKANDCKVITLENRDDVKDIDQPDIILANINMNVLLINARSISLISGKGTLLLMSGFLSGDEEAILNSFNTYGFVKKNETKRDSWISLLMGK
ncbi:MAG: 50S ribosomal protein L11 methyltransferase [Ginsengibacter sp.]